MKWGRTRIFSHVACSHCVLLIWAMGFVEYTATRDVYAASHTRTSLRAQSGAKIFCFRVLKCCVEVVSRRVGQHDALRARITATESLLREYPLSLTLTVLSRDSIKSGDADAESGSATHRRQARTLCTTCELHMIPGHNFIYSVALIIRCVS